MPSGRACSHTLKLAVPCLRVFLQGAASTGWHRTRDLQVEWVDYSGGSPLGLNEEIPLVVRAVWIATLVMKLVKHIERWYVVVDLIFQLN